MAAVSLRLYGRRLVGRDGFQFERGGGAAQVVEVGIVAEGDITCTGLIELSSELYI